MVQEILSDMDSDLVESIFDTVESEQVVTILKSTYYAMMSNRDWPHLRRSIQISSSLDPNRPTHMKLQDGIKELCFIKYNKEKLDATRKDFGDVKYLQPDHFLHKTNNEDSSSANVKIVKDFGGIDILVRTDRAPSYYTSFDDKYVVFDSYDSEVDTTLQESKVQAMAYVMPTWVSGDGFIPDLPENAFTILVEEAKSKASYKLRQQMDEKAEQEAARQNRWMSRKARKVSGGLKYPDYGRKGRK